MSGNHINRGWIPPGFRPGPQWDKIQRLAAQMAAKEGQWIEAALRQQLPEWVLYTMDAWHMTLPCKWYSSLRGITFAKRPEREGTTIQIIVGGKVVRQARSRIDGDAWKLVEEKC